MLDVLDRHVDCDNDYTAVHPRIVKLCTLKTCDLLPVNFLQESHKIGSRKILVFKL